MNEFLAFKKMVTPVIIQVIFWIGIIAIVIGGLGAMFQKGFFMGLLILILGPIGWRVYCEILIVIFRIHDNLAAIRNQKTGAV